MTPRRDFLRSLGLAALTVAIRPRIFGADLLSAAGEAASPCGLSATAFAERCGSTLRLSHGFSSQELRIHEVIPGRAQAKAETFTIRFRGAATAALPEGIYRAEHADFGAMDLHLVPGTVEQGEARYRASFAFLR